MFQKLTTVFYSVLLALFASSGHCETAAVADSDEIQVLIDVSGSMKQNDPQNLRVDACTLLMNLLPEGGNASLWVFAEKATRLIQGEQLDAKWKQQASKFCGKIDSHGIYTHIEEAIQSVMRDGFGGHGQKHLILLTDGMVDISRDIMVSADSRERILSEWIPRLQQQNIKVQTIALSGQADQELLEKLAVETGGWSETAESAEQLQRAFLKMAQKAAPKDALPLQGNRFNVDAGVKEFSLLVFKKPSAPAVQLFAPDQHKLDHHDVNVAWIETAGYDLITVKQPAAGEWRIDAVVDPDNQVMILTDLKLQLEALPNFISSNQSLTIKATMTEQGQPISRIDFTNVLAMTVAVDHQSSQAMRLKTGADAGYWTYNMPEMAAGKHTLTINADGKSFQREMSVEIEVVVAPIKVEQQIDQLKRVVSLKLIPDNSVLDVASLAVTAMIQQPGKPSQSQVISNQAGEWRLQLEPVPSGSSMQVSFSAMAKTLDGKVLEPDLVPVVINDSTFKVDSEQPRPDESATVEPIQQPGEGDHSVVHEEVLTPPSDARPWGVVIAVVLAVNLLVIGGGFLIHKAIKKNIALKQQQLLERLS